MDFSTPAAAIASIQGIGYILLYFMFIVEGPILNFIAAFSSSLGFFNVFIVLILAILGNVTGDIIYFYVGKTGRKSKRVQRFISRSIKPERLIKINNFLKKHPGKTIATIKVSPFIPGPGIITIGMSDMTLKKYLSFSVLVDIIMCSTITIIGYYSGALFGSILKYYEYGVYALGLIAAATILFLILMQYILKKISTEIEEI